MRLISVEDILDIHDLVIKQTGGLNGIKDPGRLDSAVAALKQNVFGVELYPSLLHKAASLMRALISDHPFFDGNKRTAMLCALSFLEINNITFATEVRQIENFAVRIATKKLDIDQIVAWLLDNTVPTN